MATLDIDPLVCVDSATWGDWLIDNADISDGVWLMLAKKGTVAPTSLRYQEALEEALCHGWIDGQRRSGDGHTFFQRFTPRRARSIWSKRNVDIVERLECEGLMHPRGRAEVERAQHDGRWDRAYEGQANAQVPRELESALAQNDAARDAFEQLRGSARYSALHPVLTAHTPETLDRRISALITRLSPPQ